MQIVSEGNTYIITCTFTDENGLAIVPTAARYRLDDKKSQQEILDWTAFVPTASTHDLTITATQNAIINTDLAKETKILTVEITYGTDSKLATNEYQYDVVNLKYYP